MSTTNELIDQSLFEAGSPTPRRHQTDLLNDTSIFYKGLFGMILCILPGAIIGLVLVKLSLDQAKMAITDLANNPSSYRAESVKRVKNGRLMARIGLVFFILDIIAILAFF
jgi:hypothetical protein